MSWLFLVAGIFAVLNWYAVAVTNKKIDYVAKPLTLISLGLAYATHLSWPPSWWEITFGLGLFFSLIGNVFLMLSRDQILPGLGAVLLAQLAYIVAINFEGLRIDTATILMMIAIALISIPVAMSILSALKDSQRSRLAIPVSLYSIVLSFMFWSAAGTLYRPDWTRLSAGLMAFGGASFFLSDSILAWDMFVRPIPRARLLKKFTYHSAQFAITFGFLLHWGYI